MNRKNKNILFVFLLVVVLCITFMTIKSVNLSQNNMGNNMQMPSNGDNMGGPPDMNNSSSDNTDNGENSTPPEKPDGESDTSNSDNSTKDNTNNNTPLEKPDGEGDGNNSNNTPPKMPDNKIESNSSSNIKYYVIFGIEGLILSILIIYLILSKANKKTLKETFTDKDKLVIFILSCCLLSIVLTYSYVYINKNYFSSNNSNNSNNNQTKEITYSSNNKITEESSISDKTYESTSSDENALLISASSSFDNITINKTGDSESSDNTSFYGTNSGILVKDGATVNIENSTIETNANGSNGVFSYGGNNNDGTTINISDSKITTKKDNSGGIMTTGGGNMNATNLTINTSGTSSAAIRSDRGGGNVTVSKGTYTTNGQGSPAIYSTANISVSDATLISNKSEGIVIEGANSVSIENCNLTDNNTTLNGQSTTYKNIFLYQSMSGDADVGNATFTAKNSTITTNKGDSFYVTNTKATINLENNTIVNNDSTGNFLRVKSDSWGSSGSNGGDVTLNLTNQEVDGNIVVDSISTLTINMTSSAYEGIINSDDSAKNIKLVIDSSSKIKLLGDSYVTSFEGATSNIDFNGYKLYVNGKSLE